MRPTIIVAGCARSGLTMTMQMLLAGGVPVVGEFPAFEEYELGSIPWGEVQGKAVKLVDSHLQWPLDAAGPYRVLLTTRNIVQQAMSTAKFLKAVGFILPIDQLRFRKSIERDVEAIHQWAGRQESVLTLPFETTLAEPQTTAAKIRDFIGPEYSLDADRAAGAVIKRSPKCYPGMMETRWL